ncbi:porin family protein [Aurantibacillus circumpalustris]|uniref:porin family protein n=1 Tax=Aurantibacillus circumpalustris TaxID=3036359 RepID=UPI00295BE26E|nr:porin family protein [Aurantibacillus circumpalustris]
MRGLTKKITNILVFLGSIYTFDSSAQISIGVKTGANFSQYNFVLFGEERSDILNSYSYGLNIGIPIEIRISKVYAIQLELNYIGKGGDKFWVEYTTNTNGWERRTSTIKAKVNCIDIPLLFKLGVNREKFGVNFMIGPSFGFIIEEGLAWNNTYGSSSGQNTSEADETSISIGEKNFVPGFDFGVNAGAELAFKLGPGKVFADFRYQYGFGVWIVPINSRGIQTVIGYRIPLSKSKESEFEKH